MAAPGPTDSTSSNTGYVRAAMDGADPTVRS